MSQAIYASRTIPRFAVSVALLSLSITLDSHQTGALTRDSSAAATSSTVTRSDDPTPGSLTATCGFTSGTLTASAGVTRTFEISAAPLAATVPISFVIEATDAQTISQAFTSPTINVSYRRATPGVKTVRVVATNELGSVETSFTVTVDGGSTPATPAPTTGPGGASRRTLLPVVSRWEDGDYTGSATAHWPIAWLNGCKRSCYE
jgi:hypothetical protein